MIRVWWNPGPGQEFVSVLFSLTQAWLAYKGYRAAQRIHGATNVHWRLER